jgi:putative endonuclease
VTGGPPDHSSAPQSPEPAVPGADAPVSGQAGDPAGGQAGDPAGGQAGVRARSGSDHRRARGAQGESLAAQWYEDNGYEILDRNWRRREGEVDLIVRRGKTVVFIEVKTRSSDRFGSGAESVLDAKQRRIRRLAARWLSELTPASGRARVEVRFDVVTVTAGRVEVIEDAF